MVQLLKDQLSGSGTIPRLMNSLIALTLIKCHGHYLYNFEVQELETILLHTEMMIQRAKFIGKKKNFYRFWKLSTLIPKAKTKAKSDGNTKTTAATAPRKSCLKP